MKQWKLLWKLYSTYLCIIIFSLIIFTLYAINTFRDFHNDQIEDQLTVHAHTVNRIYTIYKDKSVSFIKNYINELGRELQVRITIIKKNGVVLADSHKDAAKMENHSDRPEIISAQKGDKGVSSRLSPTLDKQMVYVAIPHYEQSEIPFVIRTSKPRKTITETIQPILFQILMAGLIVALFSAIFSFFLSHKISSPIKEILIGAENFAKGKLSHKLTTPDTLEFAKLSQSLNKMAGDLNSRLLTISNQKNELETLISNMDEALLVVDMKEHITKINRSAAELFHISIEDAIGHSFQEIIRNKDLHSFIKTIIMSGIKSEDEVNFYNSKNRILYVRGSLIHDANGNNLGILIVLNDVTKLKKLENLRKDFVANVSHELRTPITSIKGYIETLLDGAINDRENATKFLDIIFKHTNRLGNIIEDLLTLSRIERDSGEGEVFLEQAKLHPIIESTIQLFKKRALDKHIRIEHISHKDITGNVNAPLLEQALSNLIDNAIKYSEEEKQITISVKQTDEEIAISVIDEGFGIHEEHFPRLFERFYRVDKARSRKAGGTGLGLAIVKHIALVHNGSVSVKSSPGTGSVFTIHLPG